LLVERNLKRSGNLVFTRIVEASKEEDKALLVPRRVAFTENFDDGAK
jgi:hypothetical protein